LAEIKFTKNELRAQQKKLGQLEKYLPTLQLKKAMLQMEVNEARHEIKRLRSEYEEAYERAVAYSALLTEPDGIDLQEAAKVSKVLRGHENIAGVDVPLFEGVEFSAFSYALFDVPAWVDAAISGLRRAAKAKAQVLVAEEKKAALEKELRDVSIRVNLFEKVLIPRAQANIKKIKVFLGDQELAAVSQAKVAKGKIEAAREKKEGGPSGWEAIYAN